ncbi:DUF6325 family protein [Herbiconiux sp. VKM Ac-2851]|uniref:DUF6325 family protein n=1 Tax=Herbiconiux sp. VKM Ac-2851 TaxID=2739025 RepID=UPI00156506FA|nr:DUF6325 family protein [Herbiconiux sp. VKM Ac-2851]NQX36927.1 hypothetical protein [Herbiconiux sp. VKM Ac-2851]
MTSTDEQDFAYGPVELCLVGFAGERPGSAIVEAILDLVRSDTVRLLDLLFVSRSLDGELTVLEVEEVAEAYGLPDFELVELGLTGDEDIAELAEAVGPGSSAAALVIEHRWARTFARALFEADGAVLRTERIPATVVNDLVSAVDAAG